MRKIFLPLLLFFFISCSMQEEPVHCKSGFGYLYKDSKKFVCPFEIQKRVGTKREWVDLEEGVIIFEADVDEYTPLKFWNATFAYNLQMTVPKKHFSEEQYIVALRAVDENSKDLGESRDVIFYRISENAEAAVYHTWVYGETYRDDYGTRIFFGQKEMPSHDWYHVINVGTRQQGGFYIIGELVK